MRWDGSARPPGGVLLSVGGVFFVRSCTPGGVCTAHIVGGSANSCLLFIGGSRVRGVDREDGLLRAMVFSITLFLSIFFVPVEFFGS
jgi:hypothetical protein